MSFRRVFVFRVEGGSKGFSSFGCFVGLVCGFLVESGCFRVDFELV